MLKALSNVDINHCLSKYLDIVTILYNYMLKVEHTGMVLYKHKNITKQNKINGYWYFQKGHFFSNL